MIQSLPLQYKEPTFHGEREGTSRTAPVFSRFCDLCVTLVTRIILVSWYALFVESSY